MNKMVIVVSTGTLDAPSAGVVSATYPHVASGAVQPATVVVAPAELLAVFGSVVSAETVAVFTSVPATVGVTTIVINAGPGVSITLSR